MRRTILKLLPLPTGIFLLFLMLVFHPGLAFNQTSDNRILTVAQPELPQVSVHIVFAHDGPALQMHYVEHLSWLNAVGSQDHPKDRDTNAWTTDLAVGYWLSGKPEDLPDLLRTLAGVFEPITLPDDFAGQEKTILRREYDLRLVDNINRQAATVMNAFLYQGNAIATSPLGTPEQIAALDYDAARALHDATHLPQNATLVVVGNITDGQVQEAVAAAGLAGKIGTETQITPPDFNLAPAETRVFTFDDPAAAPRMIWRKVVTLKQPVNFDLLETQTALLGDILDTNLPGGLAGPLRYDAFITRRFSVSVIALDERHIELRLSAAPDRGVSFARLQAAFETALAISEQNIPPATWERVRERFKTYWPDWNDKKEVGNWMADYVLNRVQNLRIPLGKAELRQLDVQLARDDLNELLLALAGPGRTAVAFIGKDQK
ncbi:M16 family metallopeptidase [Profundibacter sp.]|uniref:M16 family metallopeptidase n=1 Tax=Profundibacter sp. TaxID=3101071 RepID=UPI003D100563